MVLAAILCFVQSLIINSIVNGNKILPRKNYMAGAVFIIFASFFKESLLLSPSSIALTFILLSVARLISLIRKEKSYGDVFDVGFLVALASLFYFPCLLFVLFAYIGLATVRPFGYRDWTIMLLGFLSPFIMLFTFYYWNDNARLLFSEMVNLQSGGWLVITTLDLSDKIMMGGMVICIVAGLILLPASLYSSLIQVRKFANTLVVFIVLALLSILLQQNIHVSHLVLLALPLGIIASMVLMQIKRTLVSEVIHIILILFVLAGQFFYLIS